MSLEIPELTIKAERKKVNIGCGIAWSCFMLLFLFPFDYADAQKLKNIAADTALTRKLAPALINRISTENPGNYRALVKDKTAFMQWLRQHLPTVQVKNIALNQNLLNISGVSKQYLPQLLACPWLIYIDVPDRLPQTERALNNADLTANQVEALHLKYPELNGEGLIVSVKEQPFDTTDIDFKGRILKTELFNQPYSAHATDMATLIGGAGNSAPAGKGVAWNVQLTASDFVQLLPDNTEDLIKVGVTVQNHSYGVKVENYYGLEAYAYDQQCLDYPSLLHVFSAGNAGTEADKTGTYANLKGWANLTGQFKVSKNTLSVGASDTSGQVSFLSSRGPAYDGRLKPELMAFGENGTSEAAALVSGISLLVQQAYQKQNNNLVPPASLVKAVLLNSAHDQGRPGIDFETGFGQADALGAVQTIRDKRYFTGDLSQQQTKTFTIQVPPGTQQLKVTLVWHDPEAEPNAAKALINDLDLTLYQNTTGRQWQPWVLNSYPHPDSLQQLPKRQADHLNNAEQITLDFPEAGTYQLQVLGYAVVPSAMQNFSLAYELVSGISWSYPNTGSQLVPGKSNRLRWEGVLPNTKGILEYQLAGSSEWHLIKADINLAKNTFNWVTPDTVALAQLRLTTGNQVIISGIFMLASALPLQVGYNCEADFMLYWPRLQEAQAYQVYQLNGKFLEPYIRTTDTILFVNKNQNPAVYYAVAPVIEQITGPRSFTLNYAQSGIGCYIKDFLPRRVVADTVIFDAVLSTAYGLNAVSLQRRENGVFKTIQTITPVIKTDYILKDLNPKPGRNDYRLQVTSNGNNSFWSQPEFVFYTPADYMQLYPNPVKTGHPLNVVIASDELTEIFIYDNLGRLAMQTKESGAIRTIATATLKPGVYFVCVRTLTGKLITKRFVLI